MLAPPPRVERYTDLAARVLALPPSCGRTRVVAVDGGAGAGKTTFAARLAAALGGAPVLHTDDLLEGWADTVTFWPRLREGVLAPLREGREGGYRRYDWHAGRFAEGHAVPPVPALVVEGVSAAAATGRDAAFVVWVEAPEPLRLGRGIARDGEVLRGEWEAWLAREREHFAREGTRTRADLVVDGARALPREGTGDYVALD